MLLSDYFSSRMLLLDPLVDRRLAFLTVQLYAFAPGESLVQRQSEQLDIDVVAQVVARHAPDLVSDDYTTVVVDQVVSFQAQRQVKLSKKGNQWKPLEERLVKLSKLEEQLGADGHHWIEIVIITRSILNSERVKTWERPQVAALRLLQIKNFAENEAQGVGQAKWQYEAPWSAIVHPLEHEHDEYEVSECAKYDK